MMEEILYTLNIAYKADPIAIHSLVCNRVPCNQALVDHPHFPVQKSTVCPGDTIGAMGLLNCALSSIGVPKIALSFSDDKEPKFLGFVKYMGN